MSEPWLYSEGTSDCCGANVYLGVCAECHEHCGLAEDDDAPACKSCGHTDTMVRTDLWTCKECGLSQ